MRKHYLAIPLVEKETEFSGKVPPRLAELLHGFAVSISILFGQMVFRDLKLILVPLCKHKSYVNNPQTHK